MVKKYMAQSQWTGSKLVQNDKEFGSTPHCSLCENLNYKIPFKVIMFPNISYVPYNFYNARALNAKNNEIVKREDNERKMKREEKLKMLKRNGHKKEHLKILLYHYVITTLCVNH
jgi:hypothetical protein